MSVNPDVDVCTYFREVVARYFPQLLDKYGEAMGKWKHYRVADLVEDDSAWELTKDLYLLVKKNLIKAGGSSTSSPVNPVVPGIACVLYEIVRLRKVFGAKKPRQPVHSYLGAVATMNDPVADDVLRVLRGMGDP